VREYFALYSSHAAVLIGRDTNLSRTSVCCARAYNSKARWHAKTDIGVNVFQGRVERCANSHLKRSKIKVSKLQKPSKIDEYIFCNLTVPLLFI